MTGRARQIQWLLIVGGYWVLQLVYLVWPMDVLPDPMPVVGQADDAGGMLSALLLTLFAVFTKKLSAKPTNKTPIAG